MVKKKLERFAELETFTNVFQHVQSSEELADFYMKGKWNTGFFKNSSPVVLELGCGRGEYTEGMARLYPEKNFIGMDIKGARIWRGAKTALDEKLMNVAFVRGRVDMIERFFSANEVSEIWITFPDPQLQKNRERKRLTSPRFLDKYQSVLKKDGIIYLKTDNSPFFHYTLEVIKERGCQVIHATEDLYGDNTIKWKEDMLRVLEIKTFYEDMFTKKGFKICYLQFKL
jgi:tRNA (guanine-N7-)-methyltransferase